MCLAVYLGASQKLPEISWVDDAPAFYVERLRSSDDAVRAQFEFHHVYYAGSHEGCGCGFLKDGEVGEELERVQENYTRLAKYLRDAVALGASTQLFACWEGDQTKTPEFNERLTPREIESPIYELKERLLASIEPDDA